MSLYPEDVLSFYFFLIIIIINIYYFVLFQREARHDVETVLWRSLP